MKTEERLLGVAFPEYGTYLSSVQDYAHHSPTALLENSRWENQEFLWNEDVRGEGHGGFLNSGDYSSPTSDFWAPFKDMLITLYGEILPRETWNGYV